MECYDQECCAERTWSYKYLILFIPKTVISKKQLVLLCELVIYNICKNYF